jgi:adenine-specific DNA-methyltransferase
MKSKKLSGSFYTPKVIADFLVDYLFGKLKDDTAISILEPSAGDGIFVKTIYNHELLNKKIEKFVAVEKSKRELNKITKEIKSRVFTAVHNDFLNFQDGNAETFSLVIGNPPYIKKSLLTKSQIEYCKRIHQNANLAEIRPNNIWTSFLVRCVEFTNDKGILAFILPSELLQVKFAGELRELILNKFERIEIFTFNELLFKDCKGQDTILLIAEKKSKEKGVYYCNIGRLIDLNKRNFTLAQNIKIKESKWTHYHLEPDEIDLLEKLKLRIQTVNDYCYSKAGIVTAANDFFIVSKDVVENYSLHQFIKPIIQKGAFVNGGVELTEVDFQMLIDKSKPSFLISLDKNSLIRKNAKILRYLELGKERNLDTRYKTSMREKWYEIPNIGVAPDAFFFKRCSDYPKLVKNCAGVLATDSAYIISMRNGFKIENLIYSFYNSLTLAFAELYGRYYGGGVLELTPNEFKILPVPYLDLTEGNYNSFVVDFKNKNSIAEICNQNDKKVLKSIDRELDDVSIEKIFQIREKLFHRRNKSN